jgi:hypothetical protein
MNLKKIIKEAYMEGVSHGIYSANGNNAAAERYIESQLKVNYSNDLIERAMAVLDDYLNAGCKTSRQHASNKARDLYKEYHGTDYVNRKDR